MVIVLLGAPGAGKGSVSNYLVKNCDFLHFSTGDIFRQIMSQKSDLSLKLKNIILAGKLVDNKTTNDAIKQSLANVDLNNKDIILDGYPRNLEQAMFLQKIVNVDFVLDINVSEKEIIKRITGRRICPVCKEIYNIYYKKPKLDNVCDNDNTLLIQRADDNETVVVNRYKQYLENNKPMVDFYKQLNVYHQVDNEIFSQTMEKIKAICKL